MKILAAGGGSGGHVTPLIAVLNELSKHDTQLQVLFVCDRPFVQQATALMGGVDVPLTTKAIFAGKFRRYHGVSLGKQLSDIPTLLHNMRDLFLVGIGFGQSLWQMLRFKPDVVFTKGGFVCLPVGLAAACLKIPLVIHDSDAHPGLTNRILARYATSIATGAPLENYTYPAKRTHYVGIPVREDFHPVTSAEQRLLKSELGLPDTKRPLVVVTGGGLGAVRINRALLAIAPALLEHAAVYHITGTYDFTEVSNAAPSIANYIVKPFVKNEMAAVLGAADVVVTRAGATTMSELASLAKPVVIIPNAMLTGGHQLKNAAVYAKAKAAVVLQEAELEKQPGLLLKTLIALLDNREEQERIGKALHAFAQPDAALNTAMLIVSAAAKPVEHRAEK